MPTSPVLTSFLANRKWNQASVGVLDCTQCILDVIIQGELEREPGGQTSLPDNNLVLVYVNDINSFMTILIIIIFSFERNQINLDLLSNNANFLQISEICCIASVLNEFKMGHCRKNVFHPLFLICIAFSVNFSNCQFGFHVLEYYLAVTVHLNIQLT